MMSASSILNEFSMMVGAMKAGPEGRGTGSEFVYGRDDEASKEGGEKDAPHGYGDGEETEKSMTDWLAPLEALIKAGTGPGGHKYKSRRGTKGHYEYDYGEGYGVKPRQQSLFGAPTLLSGHNADRWNGCGFARRSRGGRKSNSG